MGICFIKQRIKTMKKFFALFAVVAVLAFAGCNTGYEVKCACGEGADVSECACCTACLCSHAKNDG